MSGDVIGLEPQGAGSSGGGNAFTPAVPGNWSPAPTTEPGALNQLAARVTTLEGSAMSHPGTSTRSVVSVGASSTPLLTSNSTRQGFTLVNEGSQAVHVTLGSPATLANESIPIDPGGSYIDQTGWTGPVTALVASGSASVSVTDLTP